MLEDEEKDRNYEVDYRRPPTHSKFKPGQSGNPGGRPKKSKQLNALFQNELDKTIVVKEEGNEKRITKREAIITQLVNQAIKGDSKPLQLMIAYLQNIRQTEPFVSTAEDDAELLRALSKLGVTNEVGDGTV